DFYTFAGEKFGAIQSLGPVMPYSSIVNGPNRRARYPFDALTQPLRRRLWEATRQHRTVLAAILEDLPFADNRVYGNDCSWRQRIRFSYTLQPTERERIGRFILYARIFFRWPRWWISDMSADNTKLAHACGTCRFGNDPRISVLDRFNRAHTIDNLYVVD